MTNPTYWRIALPIPLRRHFDYLPPYDEALVPARGARVRVPFGKRELIGVFWGSVDQTSVPLSKLQRVRAVLDRDSLLSPGLLALAEFSAQYYLHPLGEVLSHCFPTLLRHSDAPLAARLPGLARTENAVDEKRLVRAPRQRALLQWIEQQGGVVSRAEAEDAGFAAAQWQALITAGLLQKMFIEPDQSTCNQIRQEQAPLLQKQQANAVQRLQALQGFTVAVLDGVTGSGKTEVYMHVIAQQIRADKQVLVLVPEIGLTPQTEQRFRARFGEQVTVIHSAMTDRQRWLAWEAARLGHARVIIGTRSALFVSLPRPGLIVVDEEHDSSFKQQEGFRYHARDLAVRRAQLENIPIILGSATPSLESLRNVQTGRYQRVLLSERIDAVAMPSMHTIDLRRQLLDEGISEAALSVMQQHLARGKQVLLFLNRRGFAPAMMCHACGHVMQCKRCDTPFTLHKKIGRLRCHHCAAETAVPSVCSHCRQQQWLMLGQGTERIEQMLQRHFPHLPIARIDRDTSRGRGAMARWHAAIIAGEYRILLGTQMLAKGHDFPNVSLVVVLDADSGLFATDFRAPEKLAQLITQVSGRAGRGGEQGQVLLQTHQPDHPLLQSLLHDGYRRWSELALEEREQHGLPPYQGHVLLRAEARKVESAVALLQRFRAHCQRNEAITVLGPVPATMALRDGRYRFQLLLEAGDKRQLINTLQTQLLEAEQWPEARAARWSVDVDPQDMM